MSPILSFAFSLLASPQGLIPNLPPVLTEETHTLAAPNRVVVQFKHPMGRLAAGAMGYPVLREIPGIGYTVLLTPYGRVDEAVRRLKQSGLVLEADPDHVYRPAYTPNDPVFPSQWNLVDQKIPAAWDVTKGTSAVIVAVLDTGVDYNHPELSPNVWHNAGEVLDGIDNDANGYVDDTIGWDFGYGDRDPMDDYGHGTACAGIIGATQDNNYQISGIAPGCRVMDIKIAQSDGYSYDSMFAPAMVYGADNGADVFSISYFGDGITPALRAATDYAWSKGVVVCVAAGNADSILPFWPAAYDRAISVAAHDSADDKAWFSDLGTWVDVSAPGVGIPASTWGGGYTLGFGGTSAACPNAAGVVALIRSRYPSENNASIRHRLEYGTVPMKYDSGIEVCTYGRVDALKALGVGPVRRFDKPEILHVSAVTLPAEGGQVVVRGRYFKPSSYKPVVTLADVPLPYVTRSDDTMVVQVLPGSTSGYVKLVGRYEGEPVWINIAGPGAPREVVPSDLQFLGTPGPDSGGRAKDLWHADGQNFVGAGSSFALEILVRGVDQHTVTQLTGKIQRSLQNAPNNGSATVEMYDFASGSYPYGNWVTVANFYPLQANGTDIVSPAGPASRWVSYEGDLFVRYTVNLNSPVARMNIDRLWFEWK